MEHGKRSTICPECREAALERVRRRWWMRLAPGSRHFECRICHARCWWIFGLHLKLSSGRYPNSKDT